MYSKNNHLIELVAVALAVAIILFMSSIMFFMYKYLAIMAPNISSCFWRIIAIIIAIIVLPLIIVFFKVLISFFTCKRFRENQLADKEEINKLKAELEIKKAENELNKSRANDYAEENALLKQRVDELKQTKGQKKRFKAKIRHCQRMKKNSAIPDNPKPNLVNKDKPQQPDMPSWREKIDNYNELVIKSNNLESFVNCVSKDKVKGFSLSTKDVNHPHSRTESNFREVSYGSGSLVAIPWEGKLLLFPNRNYIRDDTKKNFIEQGLDLFYNDNWNGDLPTIIKPAIGIFSDGELKLDSNGEGELH